MAKGQPRVRHYQEELHARSGGIQFIPDWATDVEHDLVQLEILGYPSWTNPISRSIFVEVTYLREVWKSEDV